MGTPYAEVIGDPIAHSKSPLIHRFWLGKLRLEGEFYAVRVTKDSLHTYLSLRRSDPNWRGCNITSPLKEAAIAEAEWLDPMADKDDPYEAGAGAINTLVPSDDKGLRGYSTDAFAVRNLVLARIPAPPPGAYAISHIIGAGGAARAATRGLLDTPYGNPFFYNRTEARAQDLSIEHRGQPQDGYPLAALNDPPGDSPMLIVNATPMGMTGYPPVPIDLAPLPSTAVILDMVYTPVETPLVRAAKALGLQVIDGLDMLVEQAAPAFQFFFGASAPRQHDAELRELLTS